MDGLKGVLRNTKRDLEKLVEDSVKQTTERQAREINLLREELEKVVQESVKKMAESQAKEIKLLREELEEIKKRKPCLCHDLFEAFVTAGNLVFSGNRVNFHSSTGLEDSALHTEAA